MKRIYLLLILLLPLFLIGQNQNISGGIVYEGEPFLTTNPTNSQHIVVAWMGYLPLNGVVIKTKVSFDGGQSWSTMSSLPHAKPSYGSADPSMEFDNNGDLFLSYVDFDAAIDSGEVYVSKSVDGGLNWQTPVEVIHAHADPGRYAVDRPWISVDRSGGANDGNIYVTTMSPSVFGPLIPPFDPYFVSSTNGGTSFNSWQYLDTLGWLSGDDIQQPMPTHCVAADGTFYAVYPSYLQSQSLWPRYILASSTDAGNDFTHQLLFNSITVPTDPLAKSGYLLRANPADANHIAFFYLDVTHGDIDVFMRESLNGGSSWTGGIRINDDAIANNRMQDLVWADFDEDGDLVVSWRDRRGGADSTYAANSEIWGAVRWKDSTNFSANFRISDTTVAYDAVLAQSGNDFMCVNLVDDTLAAVWGDVRASGKLNVWFQRLDPNGAILSTIQISSEVIPQVSLYPNPSSDLVSIEAKNLIAIKVLSQNGQEVINLGADANVEKTIVDISTLSDGIYFFQVTTEEGIVSKKLVKN